MENKDQTAAPNSSYAIYCTQPGRDYVAETNVQTAKAFPSSSMHIETVRHSFIPEFAYTVMSATKNKTNVFNEAKPDQH